MSIGSTEEWFSPSVRRGRRSYFLAKVMLYLIVAVIALAVIYANPSNGTMIAIAVLFGVPFILCIYFLTAQRLRDIGVSGWFSLIWLPIGWAPEPYSFAFSLSFFIALVSIPGTPGVNRYGSP